MLKYITFLLALFLLCGCTNSSYDGENLHIGVIGSLPDIHNPNVQFSITDASALEDENKDDRYDAFFITCEHFQHLSSPSWANVYDQIETPVFFINANQPLTVFHEEEFLYNNEDFPVNAHTTGFVNTDSEQQITWAFGEPVSSENVDDTPPDIFDDIFAAISEGDDHSSG
ncbi:hypothetical protein [Salisediminibacterium halotolerans]|uniref:Lipoprotein n=1 Tax=Salisediminibacterium halotolerans TaxID=517425 RepID=A0A1H9VY94_9BACI|nr:hypothetical protein [Salisediminibacterium haloalkalitolerans]SES26740.1 hypothetical protein SAMN05444126_12528 [Salisediminibacterium haloalkalitolerans]